MNTCTGASTAWPCKESRLILCGLILCGLFCGLFANLAQARAERSSRVTSAGPNQMAPLGLLSAPPSKSNILNRLKELRNKQIQLIENINQSMTRILRESQDISLQNNDPIRTEKHIQSLPIRLSTLQKQRAELLLQRAFIDQLIFHVDSKWTTQPLAVFLEQTLLDMATQDLTTTTENTGKTDLWRFYTYLSIALREIPDPREDLLEFLISYMEFSGLESPKSPLAFLDSRHYTGGSLSQSARPVRRDEVGRLVERQLKRANAILPSPRSSTESTPPEAPLTSRISTTRATDDSSSSSATTSATSGADPHLGPNNARPRPTPEVNP